jgi:hypothetical protein
MNAPQIVMIVILALGVGISMEQHGRPKTGTENCVITIIATGIMVALMYWGGFWS